MRRLATFAAFAVLASAPSATAQEGESSTVRPDEPTATGRAVIGAGHVDLGPRFVDGTFRLQVRDDTVRPSVWRNLDDVVLQARDASRVEVPDEPRFAFLGRPGSPVWLLPQVQDQRLLWPGWNSQDPEVARRVRRELTWRLHDVQGPGEFVLFSSDGFGEPTVLFDSSEPAPQEVGVEVDTHVHGNWTFSRPGTYLLDVEMRAALDDGEQVSDRRALRIHVGDRDPQAAFAAALPATDGGAPVGVLLGGGLLAAGLAAAVLLLRRRRPA